MYFLFRNVYVQPIWIFMPTVACLLQLAYWNIFDAKTVKPAEVCLKSKSKSSKNSFRLFQNRLFLFQLKITGVRFF